MTEAIPYVSHFAITLDGANIPADLAMDISEVTVENSLHLPDMATIIIQDLGLKWVDDARFNPGTQVKISAGFGIESRQIFAGEIVEIEPVFAEEALYLAVRAFDKLHRLSRGRSVRSFVNASDGDVIKKIAGEAGLRTRIGPTSRVHPYLLQSGLTNLEFLQQRAASLGYLLYVDGDTLVCEAPKAASAAVSLKLFEDLSEFRPRMSTVGQVNEVTVRGWNPQEKRVVIGRARNGTVRPKTGVSGSGGDMAKKAYSIEAPYVVSGYPVSDQCSADALAKSLANRYDSQFIEAEGRSRGNPKLLAGAEVKVERVGSRFSGSYFVTSSTHRFDLTSGYSTDFAVSGLQPAGLIDLLAAPAPQASAGAGAAYTMLVGVVTDNNDPQNLGRVKVKYPALSDSDASYWARLVAPDGGKGRGFQFLPEVNDEVLVGFEMGDINQPYVLGGLWNGRDAPPLTTSEAVKSGAVIKHVIRSRTGHEIMIDDSDDKGGITIKDKHGNSIVLTIEQDKLTITSKGDMTLDASGNLTLKTAKKLLIEATDKGEIKAMGLSMDGKTGNTEVKGLGVKVDGGAATVDVKGSLINLN